MGERERLPCGKLSLLVFWFAELGAVFFTRCIIGVYYRCVYCGKQCRFLFGFERLFVFCWSCITSSSLSFLKFIPLQDVEEVSELSKCGVRQCYQPATHVDLLQKHAPNLRSFGFSHKPSRRRPKISPSLTSFFPPHPATPCSTAGRTRIYQPQTRRSSSAGPTAPIQD